MNLHVHSVWPPEQEIMTGWYPEGDGVNKGLRYEVLGDGEVLEQGSIGVWILGKRDVSIPLLGLKELKLRVSVERAAKKTIFWGDPFVLLEDGGRIHLNELSIRYDNVDTGNGIGMDYYGGPVHLEGELYGQSLPFEPLDPKLPAVATLDLTGLRAVSFEGTIGGDYPLGTDAARRKTVSIRTIGKEAYFLTIIEPHEGRANILSAEATSPGKLAVRLRDGRTQELSIWGWMGTKVKLAFESMNG